MNNINESEPVPFDNSFLESENQIGFIGTGSFGGKAKGLARINSILRNEINPDDFPGFIINIPKMVVISMHLWSKMSSTILPIQEFPMSESH